MNANREYELKHLFFCADEIAAFGNAAQATANAVLQHNRHEQESIDCSRKGKWETNLKDGRTSRREPQDAESSQIAILDRHGVIVAVNESWRRFGLDNGMDASMQTNLVGIGVNYLDVCLDSRCNASQDSALEAYNGILDVLERRRPSFRLDYSCHSPGHQRWFCMIVDPMCGGYDGAVVSHLDITDTREQLRDSKEQLRALTAHQEDMLEQERKRIALELHDEMGQLLTALNLDISLLGLRLGDNRELLATIDDMHSVVARTIDVVRKVASQLRPAALDLGLTPALEWLAANFSSRWHIPCSIDGGDDDLVLDDLVATAVFRVVQESLTNVARHARATDVSISLSRMEQHLQVGIKDNGRGFDTGVVGRERGFGLFGMRERILALGGTVSIDSARGRGTTVSIELPLSEG